MLVKDHGLSAKPALIGLSRGALYCMAWASTHPEKTLLVYLDNGVCDFKSWPGGKPKGLGSGQGSPEEWPKLLKAYDFKDDREAIASRLNPVDNLAPLAEGEGSDPADLRGQRQGGPAPGELGPDLRPIQGPRRCRGAGRETWKGPPPARTDRSSPRRRVLREGSDRGLTCQDARSLYHRPEEHRLKVAKHLERPVQDVGMSPQ